MAPISSHLIKLNANVTEQSFIESLRDLPAVDRPIYVGKCHHWIHQPTMSINALTGSGSQLKVWDYLLVIADRSGNSTEIPKTIQPALAEVWSIDANPDDSMAGAYPEAQKARLTAPEPPLPPGWSPRDTSGLEAAIPPPDLDASLALSSYPLGSNRDNKQNLVDLKTFTRNFGSKYTGPIAMFNLLSYIPPTGRERYFGYIAAFSESVGSKYGGDAMFVGFGVTDWTSKADETDHVGGWEDFALIHYPSIWHFSKMLDDPGYADADRKFKQGALRDNPIVITTEVAL